MRKMVRCFSPYVFFGKWILTYFSVINVLIEAAKQRDSVLLASAAHTNISVGRKNRENLTSHSDN